MEAFFPLIPRGALSGTTGNDFPICEAGHKLDRVDNRAFPDLIGVFDDDLNA